MTRIRLTAATALALAMALAGTALAQSGPGAGGGAGARPPDAGAQSGAMQQRGTAQQDMTRDLPRHGPPARPAALA